jgi:serine/threonine protein kinase
MIGKSLGHYEILGIIGSGGMGDVYRARDKKLGRDVAIKLLPIALRGDKNALARFNREAKALAALNHPNIVTIYSIDSENEELFLTMELVEGKSLNSLIPVEGMELDDFRKIAVPLADALAAAHASGVIPRDLKPSNIIITDAGGVKVLDFGVALVMSEEPLTDANIAVGTAAYMSPEQISGGEVDGRSDIFSLGIIFYELLSGSRPFRGEHPAAIMYSIVNEEATRLSSLPEALADAVDRCLKKNPEERFAGADALRHALQDMAGAETPVANAGRPVVSSPEAQAAIDRGDWESARQTLNAIREQRDLTPEELEMLAMSALWLSATDDSIQALEKAYVAYVKSGRNTSAARVALDLVGWYIEKNASAIAGGWQKRAERLLKNEPESVEHGLLLRRQTMVALDKNDFVRAMELNHECSAVAQRCDNRDLQTVALHDHGQILVVQGDVEEGMAMVDEAMTAAVSGEVELFTVGNLYCRTMVMCESLADYNRAREWSEAAWRWCEPNSASPYLGICRVHSATAMRYQGRWKDADKAVRKACVDFKKNGPESHAGEALNELGELALRKGEYEEAEDAFRQAHEHGYDPVPGLPLLRLAQGKHQAALQTIERALNEAPEDRLRRAKLLTASIVIALGNNEVSLAKAAVDELSIISKDYACPSFKAHALMGQGAIELERGDGNTGTQALREAWTIFNEMNFPYDAARARTLMAEAYLQAGNKEDATLQLNAAYKTFGELGAKPDLETVSRLIEKSA